MEKEKNPTRPTTAEKILLSGVGGNLIVIGTALILGQIGIESETNRKIAHDSLIGVHLGMDLIQFVGAVGLRIEAMYGKENFVFKQKKNEQKNRIK